MNILYITSVGYTRGDDPNPENTVSGHEGNTEENNGYVVFK